MKDQLNMVLKKPPVPFPHRFKRDSKENTIQHIPQCVEVVSYQHSIKLCTCMYYN